MGIPGPTTEHDFTLIVARKEVIAGGVVGLTLRDPGGGSLPFWAPGAHIDLVLRDDLIRQYSLCGDPAYAVQFEVAVLREDAGRGGSAHVHDQLVESDLIRPKGPRNHFQLVNAHKYVFIAGGIGITPIIPMIVAGAPDPSIQQLDIDGREPAFGHRAIKRVPDRPQRGGDPMARKATPHSKCWADVREAAAQTAVMASEKTGRPVDERVKNLAES